MLGGLNEITTLELFTQNYLKYDRISFTIWKRIQFWMYPPGRNFLDHFISSHRGCTFFAKYGIWSGSDPTLIRIWSAHFLSQKCADQIRIRVGSDSDQIRNSKKKFRTRFLTLETPEAIYNYCAPGGWYSKQIIYWTKKSKKLSFNSFGVQSHLFIEIV